MSDDNNAPPKRHMLTREQAAAIVYHDYKENQRATFAVASDYGRWLIASLVIINGGALWSLFSYLGSIGTQENGSTLPTLYLHFLGQQTDGLRAFAAPVWSFAVGIAAAMLSGLAAWINWSMHSNNYDQMARYEMLWDPEKWLGDAPHRWGISVTYWISIVAGIGSMVAALVGCAFIMHGNFLTG